MSGSALAPARRRSSALLFVGRGCSVRTSRGSTATAPLRATASSCRSSASIYRAVRRRSRARAALDGLRARRCSRSAPVSVLGLYVAPAAPGRAAAQPDRRRRRAAGARVQHRGQLRHQHELAELRRRVDDEPPHPDGRARRCRTSSRPRSGLAVAVALIRGLVRRRLGDDRQLLGRPRRARRSASCCRSRSCVALVLVSQGVVQNFHGFTDGDDASRAPTQAIPGGPIASQEAIKELGHERRRPYNANSAHPFENPNGFTNLVRDLRAAADPVRAHVHVRAAWSRTSGRAGRCSRRCSCSGSARPALAMHFEVDGNPKLAGDAARVGRQHGGQGGAVRRRRVGALRRLDDRHVDRRGQRRARQLHAARRRGAAREHDARRGRARAASAPGSTGCSIFALLAVFIAGLMVGRTPEYLGKKIQAAEMKLVVALHARRCRSLVLALHRASRSCSTTATSSILNPGPHGLTEVVYAFTSAANNNGSAFGGLTGQHRLVQHHARPRDARRPLLPDRPRARRSPARSARKQPVPPSAGTFPTDTPLFVGAARRRGPHRRRPHLLPRPRPRPDRRAPEPVSTQTPRSHLRPARSLRRAALDSFRKLDPRRMARNPVMFVVEVGSVLTTILFFKDLGDVDHEGERVRRARRGLALVHRAVRELRRGDGRGPRQGAGRRRCARRAPRRSRAGGWPTARSRRCRARRSPSATTSSSRPAR